MEAKPICSVVLTAALGGAGPPNLNPVICTAHAAELGKGDPPNGKPGEGAANVKLDDGVLAIDAAVTTAVAWGMAAAAACTSAVRLVPSPLMVPSGWALLATC